MYCGQSIFFTELSEQTDGVALPLFCDTVPCSGLAAVICVESYRMHRAMLNVRETVTNLL